MNTEDNEKFIATLCRGVKKGSTRAPYATKKIETVTINFRVPKERKEDCKDYIRPLLKLYLNHI